ncbi:MAG: endonuclease/exonuclease/phosphatase family protein [Candidatus Saccharibacteria bacterium]|nr:endonuclease/exonuclease/phosphatase family protein [Candidatus Saccharibacteria bacterium]
MKIIYWNTCLTTNSQDLFENLMWLHQIHKGIDYFCINEATNNLKELFHQAHWHTFYKANTDSRGVLIVSKSPLKQARSYLLSSVMRKGKVNQNHLLMIETRRGNKTFTIATTHLTYLRLKEISRRKAERKQLTRFLPRNQVIFGGDLNTVVIPFAKWDLKNLGYHSKVKGKTWCWHLKNTWKRIPFKLQLDHIFSSSDMSQVVKAKILKEQKLSDHFPILVEVY